MGIFSKLFKGPQIDIHSNYKVSPQLFGIVEQLGAF